MRAEIVNLVLEYLNKGCFQSPVYDIGSADDEYRRGQGYEFKSKFIATGLEFINLDIRDTDGIDITINAQDMTCVGDDMVGSIILTEMLEHVHNPVRVMEECYRVLKPGGLIIVTVPSYYKVHVAMPEPYEFKCGDYWRWTFQGVHLLCKEFGKIAFGEFGSVEKHDLEYFYVGQKL